MTNLFILLAIFSLLAEGHYRQKIARLKTHPIAVATTLLFAFMVVGLFYAPVPMGEALSSLDKYRELLYVPLFLLLFRDDRSRKEGLYAFMISMIVTLSFSYFIVFSGCEVFKGTLDNPTPFKNYITQGLLMSLAAYFLMIQHFKKNRWLIGILVLFMFYNIFFMTAGRTGYLIAVCLILLGGYQLYYWRGLIVATMTIGILGVMVYMSSHVLQHRIERTFTDLGRYEQGQAQGSTAMRYEFMKNSVTLVMQHPWIGTGTGSFQHEYQRVIKFQNMAATKNPHSEYLMIAIQWGLVGLTLFLYLLYRLWQLSHVLIGENRWMAQGLIMTIACGCLVNSLWLDTTEGHLFAYLIGLFYSPLITDFNKN